jgi:hypothetical protein
MEPGAQMRPTRRGYSCTRVVHLPVTQDIKSQASKRMGPADYKAILVRQQPLELHSFHLWISTLFPTKCRFAKTSQ